MDEGTATRVGTGVGRLPEGTAEGDIAEVVRVDVGVGTRVSAGAVEGVRREGVATDLGEVVEDGAVARAGVGAEPSRVAGRRGGVAREVPIESRQQSECMTSLH